MQYFSNKVMLYFHFFLSRRHEQVSYLTLFVDSFSNLNQLDMVSSLSHSQIIVFTLL
uniref:Uncharacterized protein n=1 Tax=Rhizophora mucronata TaxID=61149 RepID=A0A2P2IT19_RHIMU